MKFRFTVILGMVLLLAGSAFGAGCFNGVTALTYQEPTWTQADSIFFWTGGNKTWEVSQADNKDFIIVRVADKVFRIYSDGSIRVPCDEWVQIYPETMKFIEGTSLQTLEIPEEWKTLRSYEPVK